MDFIGDLAISLGMGQIPILNGENRRLSDALIHKQIECERIKAKNQGEEESINRIFGHVSNIKDSYLATKHLVTATKETKDAETDLRQIGDVNYGRNRKDFQNINRNINYLVENNENLEEEVAARITITELLDDEHKTDIRTLIKWTSEVDQFEEDIFTLLKFQHQDTVRVKEHHLKLERCREKVGQSKKCLDIASTDSRMAQVALDKTAEAFRQLHVERSSAMEKWQEALALISTREAELQVAFEKVSTIKNKVFNLEIELKEQTNFLDNEKDNCKELQSHIDSEENNYRRLTIELEKNENEYKEFQSEITLEKRQMWKAGAEMERKKIRMKETKNECNKQKKNVEKYKNDINGLKDTKVSSNNKALTSEEKANQMQRLLDQEQLQHDMTLSEYHKSKERLLAKQKEFKDITDEEEINEIRLKGLLQEQKNLDKLLAEKKSELIKREDVAVANDQRLVSIEREIARIKGTMSLDNRSELKAMLENFKLELDSRQAEKRNLDHLVHKVMCEVKKVHKDIENINKSKNDVTTKLEEVMLVNESCEREHKQIDAKVEALLLEEKGLKLTERKVKEDLEQLNNDLKELRKEDLEINEQLREQRAELESKKELYIAQSRCLKDEISTIRNEIRERKDRIEKLKIRHEHTIKAMGNTKKQIRNNNGKKDNEDKVPTHARHMVEVAQEKAELTEKTELLQKKIDQEEEELASLEKAMKLMRNSNDSYRVTNCRNNTDQLETDQTIELEESIKNKMAHLKLLKRRYIEVGQDIEHVEAMVKKYAAEADKMQAIIEGKTVEVKQLEKELKEQDKKRFRALNVVEKLSQELKELVPNPEAFEHDMDLREEKERQRSALIKLRELSQADIDFNHSAQATLAKVGVVIPPISRLEARATSSRMTSTASSARGTTAGGWAHSASSSQGYRQGQSVSGESVVLMETGGRTRNGKTAVPVS